MFTETTIGILTERDLAREAKLDARKSQMETAALKGMKTRITVTQQGTIEPEPLLPGLLPHFLFYLALSQANMVKNEKSPNRRQSSFVQNISVMHNISNS